MYKLFDWVYNRRLNLIGIICEERSGQYKSEYAIFYPGYKEAHTGRGFSQHGYSSEGLFFYTEGLMQDRIVPLNPDDEIMMSARNVTGAMGNRKRRKRIEDSVQFTVNYSSTSPWSYTYTSSADDENPFFRFL